jgi:hypothetical protein
MMMMMMMMTATTTAMTASKVLKAFGNIIKTGYSQSYSRSSKTNTILLHAIIL